MKRILTPALAITLFLTAAPAFALDIKDARAQGLIGEGNNGYAVALTSEASSLVNEINARRREKYTSISQTNGQSVDVVAKLAAPQIREKLSPGSSYQNDQGQWVKK